MSCVRCRIPERYISEEVPDSQLSLLERFDKYIQNQNEKEKDNKLCITEIEKVNESLLPLQNYIDDAFHSLKNDIHVPKSNVLDRHLPYHNMNNTMYQYYDTSNFLTVTSTDYTSGISIGNLTDGYCSTSCRPN